MKSPCLIIRPEHPELNIFKRGKFLQRFRFAEGQVIGREYFPGDPLFLQFLQGLQERRDPALCDKCDTDLEFIAVCQLLLDGHQDLSP